jgi:hypothetical protein
MTRTRTATGILYTILWMKDSCIGMTCRSHQRIRFRSAAEYIETRKLLFDRFTDYSVKHYGQIDRKVLLRAIAAASGCGFSTEDIEKLRGRIPKELNRAVEAVADATRRAVDFLTTQIRIPTADALPYMNQFAVLTEIFRQLPAPYGPVDFRSGVRIDVGKALAQSNEMEFHHFFPRAWLKTQGYRYDHANVLANIIMLTSLSNKAISDQAPGLYLQDEIDMRGEKELIARLETGLIEPQALRHAISHDYELFLDARSQTIASWMSDLAAGNLPHLDDLTAPRPDDPDATIPSATEPRDEDTAD